MTTNENNNNNINMTKNENTNLCDLIWWTIIMKEEHSENDNDENDYLPEIIIIIAW